jgi:hypothetical protein
MALGDVGIAQAVLAGRDLAQRGPDGLLQVGALGVDRQRLPRGRDGRSRSTTAFRSPPGLECRGLIRACLKRFSRSPSAPRRAVAEGDQARRPASERRPGPGPGWSGRRPSAGSRGSIGLAAQAGSQAGGAGLLAGVVEGIRRSCAADGPAAGDAIDAGGAHADIEVRRRWRGRARAWRPARVVGVVGQESGGLSGHRSTLLSWGDHASDARRIIPMFAVWRQTCQRPKEA